MQSSTVEAIQSKKIDQQNSISINDQNESIVSFIEDVPLYLNEAMRKYIPMSVVFLLCFFVVGLGLKYMSHLPPPPPLPPPFGV